MASVRSLGVHTPVALQYLINEGILPQGAKTDQYQWQTYVWNDGRNDRMETEEEVLSTKDTVVWSQGRFIRNVYRFTHDGEDVAHALLTRFPTPSITTRSRLHESRNAPKLNDITANSGGVASNHSTSIEDADRAHADSSLAKALVVILKTKAHVYFLQGPSHILDLPFEIARAYPAPQGLILQRKRTTVTQPPPTPQLPRVPVNSFFSSQTQASSSYLQSPTLSKSFAKISSTAPGFPNGDSRLDALFRNVIGNNDKTRDDDVAALYSLTDPLADFGVITYSLLQYKPRLSGKSRSSASVEFEGLDAAEEILYMSPKHELRSSPAEGHERLILLVTANRDINTITVWHAWYLDEKPLRTLLKMRAEHKAAKSRRRSSFLSTNINTGTATPAVRHRDGARESFAAPGTLRAPGEAAVPQPGPVTSRKPTREEEAEVMASQMDPDYQPAGSQQTARENRRISSMNADVRAGHSAVNASFGGTGSRRHTSFGGPSERRSLGYRRSRGSTPGSVFSRSIGAEDDQMDLDETIDYDSDETVDSIVRHIRATIETCGIDNVFGSMEEGFKHELVVRKIHSFYMAPSNWSQAQENQPSRQYKIFTLSNSQLPRSVDSNKVNIYLHRQDNGALRCLHLQILSRPLWPELDKSPMIPIPVLVSDERLGDCEDILKLNDENTEALLLGGRGLILTMDNSPLCSLPAPQPYRVYDSLDVSTFQINLDKDIGRNRTLQPAAGHKLLELAGARGSFDEIATDGVHHRRSLQLRPRVANIEKILEGIEAVLPLSHSRLTRQYWCTMHARLVEDPDRLRGTACSAESVAVAATVFLFVIELVDPKARAALNISQMASRKSRQSGTLGDSHGQYHGQSSSTTFAWPSMSGTAQRDGQSQGAARQDEVLYIAAALADEISKSEQSRQTEELPGIAASIAVKLMLGLHILREEKKLYSISSPSRHSLILAPMIAQLGGLLDLPGWSYSYNSYYSLEGASSDQWVYIKSATKNASSLSVAQEPVGVFQWFEHALVHRSTEVYPTLALVAQLDTDDELSETFRQFAGTRTPRISLLHKMLDTTSALTADSTVIVERMAEFDFTTGMLDTFPEAIAVPFKEAIARCEMNPPVTWPRRLLELVGRDDLVRSGNRKAPSSTRHQIAVQTGPRDILSICNALEQPAQNLKTKEASRHAVSQLIFNKDRRLVEATSLMHFNSVQVAECPKLPGWTETQHFDAQRRLMFFVTVRMIALPAGDGMLHYDSQSPLLTERYALPGFNSTVLMQPMGHTLTTDRSGLTEEKVNWAYFHAGVSSGLRISRHASGIDTSWIAFNKPNELTNRHAGLLLALGLSGHLKNVAKWLSFKYLTPKHTMTSVGLLLGLSASYLGTMDGLITRMLSVHITRMLPPGAAELNVSAVTQTAGLMGIGLLYCSTQHRRMSEVMLSEIEHMEVEDPDSGPDLLRDESYRLAAGFALGLINLGKGEELRGLHGMQLPERLLAIAVGPRPVHAVHVFDRATAGAVIAIALVFMKSGNKAIASKIDIPDTEAQFDQVRPDVLLLRAMAKQIIMWDNIVAREPGPEMQGWISDNLPTCYKGRWRQVVESQIRNRTIDSAHLPLFNIYTGLAWALGLKYAGSANEHARDDILRFLDFFHTASEGADAYYYDGKLGRSALRRCMDVLALSAATVMAGTGDIVTFRYLRRMHGRVDSDTPYGSHLAAHMAIGTLFLGGGTFTFGTTNLALASLICAFYPLFPTDVHDNRVHLQAFRHFWVFAAEPRCIIIEDIDTQRPIHMPLQVTLRSGEVQHLTAPCLLPVLDSIATICTADPSFWQVTLDFARNPGQLDAFRRDQRVLVRRCPATEAHASAFSASLAALETAAPAAGPSAAPQTRAHQLWRSVFTLPSFQDFDQAEIERVLPPDIHSSVYLDERSTSVDDRLVLAKAVESEDRDALWNLRVLFAWADREKEMGNGKLRWLGDEGIEALKARVESRIREDSKKEGKEEEE